VPATESATPVAGRIASLLRAKRETGPPVVPLGAVARLTQPVAAIVERHAAIGRFDLSRGDAEVLGDRARASRSIGLDTLAATIEAYAAAPGPRGALALAYLLDLTRACEVSLDLTRPPRLAPSR
jgi:hypothetical protein